MKRFLLLPHRFKSGNRAATLVVTLLVIALMSTIIVALIQSVGLERNSAESYVNRYQAELTAEAGAAAGVNALAATGLDFLVNSYVERDVTFNGGTITAPYLATHRLANDFSSVEETRLLVSMDGNYANISDVPEEDLVDINDPTSSFSTGLIGLATSNGTAISVPAGWVKILRDPALPEQNNPSSSGYNPVIGRFAYWIDDESAKLNINTSGNLTAPDQLKRLAGANAEEVTPQFFLSQAGDPGAAFDFIPARDALSDSGLLLSTDTTRLLDGAEYLSNNWDTLRSMLTIYSKGDERGPFRTRKINLNDFVSLNSDLSTSGTRDQIAAATVSLGEYINRVIPEFGNRAYNGQVTDADRRRYCIQIAANIRDYIDGDSQPTAITQNNLWLQPPIVTGVGAGAPTAPPLAFGKEIVPSITEYVGYYYNSAGNLRIDHSFEVLNIYSSSVNMTGLAPLTIMVSERNPLEVISPPGPVPNFPGMEGGANSPLVVTIPNSSSFPPGEYRVITTLPVGPLRSSWVDPSVVFLEANSNENIYNYGIRGIRMRGDANSTSDVATEISLVNPYGYLDFHARVAQGGFGVTGNVIFESADAPRLIASQPFGNDASTVGPNVHRKYPLDSGDPRSLTEIYPSFSEAGALTSVAWRWVQPNDQLCTILGGDSATLNYGFKPDNNVADPNDRVPEPLLLTGESATSRRIATIRNGPLKTIGELGLIYDPAVHGPGIDNSSGQITRQRGGFRTLSIGSDVGEVRGPNRLAHTLPTAGNSNISQRRAYRLLDIFSANNSETGKILVNSSLRNPQNLPIRALFENLMFQSNGSSNATSDYATNEDVILGAGGQNLNVDSLIEDWQAFERSSGGPFLSIGQIADLETFTNSDLGVNLSPNPANTNALDRGREEILRNTFGLLTLKGSIYKIYTIGQTGTVNSAGEFQPKSTAILERTVELEKVYPQQNGLQSTEVNNLVTNNTATRINVKTINTKYH